MAVAGRCMSLVRLFQNLVSVLVSWSVLIHSIFFSPTIPIPSGDLNKYCFVEFFFFSSSVCHWVTLWLRSTNGAFTIHVITYYLIVGIIHANAMIGNCISKWYPQTHSTHAHRIQFHRMKNLYSFFTENNERWARLHFQYPITIRPDGYMATMLWGFNTFSFPSTASRRFRLALSMLLRVSAAGPVRGRSILKQAACSVCTMRSNKCKIVSLQHNRSRQWNFEQKKTTLSPGHNLDSVVRIEYLWGPYRLSHENGIWILRQFIHISRTKWDCAFISAQWIVCNANSRSFHSFHFIRFERQLQKWCPRIETIRNRRTTLHQFEMHGNSSLQRD